MLKLACDICGKTLLLDEDVRYTVIIEVFAAYDPLELTEDDLRKDHRQALRDLVERMKTLDPERAQDSVYRRFEFQLCPRCQREYLRDPLRLGRSRNAGAAPEGES